ncbi:MAG: TniB family NTP-binding protein [Candidatus Competibacteraceae bacterium]|nr:TniB family NTP-binding protein [Candidatus Competibacteraceae bacterium]
MSRFQHLDASVVEALDLPKPARVAFCQADRWIGYTRATQILSQLDQLVGYPKTLRMPNVLVVGRSGNGKSSILERFTHRHPVQETAAGSPIAPVLLVEMPETPDESKLWSTVLWGLSISHREKDPAALKKRSVKSAMHYAQVRILAIDEFNNLVNAGRAAGDLLAAIKGLSNELKISVVAAGTQSAINALNSDPQMKSRFEPAVLDRWKLDGEYLRFLASYERLLPLAEPSGLATRELAPKLYGMTGDTLGATVKLLKQAAVSAIESGKERIDAKLLDQVPWVRPGEWDEVARRV